MRKKLKTHDETKAIVIIRKFIDDTKDAKVIKQMQMMLLNCKMHCLNKLLSEIKKELIVFYNIFVMLAIGTGKVFSNIYKLQVTR